MTIDGGMIFHWGFTHLHAYEPRRRFFFAGGGHLGCGQPFSNAFKVAFPDRPVLNFCGDGAFGLTLQELDTAVRHGLPVVHVINNDGGWGMCKAGQLAMYGDKALDGMTGFLRRGLCGNCQRLRVLRERVEGPGKSSLPWKGPSNPDSLLFGM